MSLVRDNPPWFKEPWPWLLMAGPLAVIAAGAVTIWLAVGSFDGLVEDDYYKQGLAVNQRLQRDHKAGELGLRADVMISGLQVRVVMTSGQYAKLPPTLNAKFIHPTRSGQDRTVVLAAEGQGIYGGTLPAEISGRWIITLEEPGALWRLQGEWRTDVLEPLRLGSGADEAKIVQSGTGR
ncbi:MAG: FixH family protein [Azonexus sp.]